MRKLGIAMMIVSMLVLVLLPVFGGGQGEAGSGGASGEGSEKPQLGAAMINLSNPFYNNMVIAGDEAAEDFGVDIVWKSAEGSLENEIAIVENFVQQDMDAILIDPIDANAIAPVVEDVDAAGAIPITMGNFVDTPYNVNTLYNDFEDFGTLTDMMAAYIGYEGNVVLLVGSPGNFVSDERQRGFEAAIKDYPDINVLSVQPSDWDPAKGLQIVENWLTSYDDIDAFMCVSDGVTMGAIEAFRNAGRLDEVAIFSYDGNIETSELMKEGVIQGNLLTGSKRVGYWNVKTAALLAKGEIDFQQKMYLPTHFVLTEENAARIEENGMDLSEVSWVVPDEAIRLFDAYREELGPQ